MKFRTLFKAATGHPPYPYQEAFATAQSLSHLLRAPTSAGKTATAILGWLWRSRHSEYPTSRRLVYCLPMRVLVEQSQRAAKAWLKALDLEDKVGLQILMGGVDSDDWFLEPDKPAILIGTQDMLLSRALNRGYAENYVRPVEFATERHTTRAPFGELPKVARYLLDGKVLPLVTDTMRVAEGFRRKAMGTFQDWCMRNSEVAGEFRRLNVDENDAGRRYSSRTFSGKDRDGAILSARDHAYYLPTAENGRRITHITLYAPNGFGQGEASVLASIRKLGSDDDLLHVQLIGLGKEQDFSIPIFANASVWQSETPYLGPAHVGLRGQCRYLRKAIRREWRRLSQQVGHWRGVELLEVTEIPREQTQLSRKPHALEFRRARSKYGESYRPARYFRLVFSEPICGPLSLGYASHFGFGLFAAVAP